MSAPAAPTIPPRPVRSHNALHATSTELPKIPPRPTNRRLERSVSPGRDSYARSPLNDAPFASNLGRSVSNDPSNFSLPPRPPSVTLPSIGQEGNEYADIQYENADPQESTTLAVPAQTRNVANDLQLHAPKPSLPKSSAKAQIQNVTRTDSHQAAAIGIGKAGTPVQDDTDQPSRDLYSKSAYPRPPSSSASTERRASIAFGDDQGIPESGGQRVPMIPNAGDVQAPSPSPFAQNFPPGIGFHNNGSQKPGRHHGRTKSGREVFLPPGSYGLHGHGVPANDKFEKAWYDKHPEALNREEHGQYGPGIGGGRGEWALSSDDLNKIVRDTASRGAGFGEWQNGFPQSLD